VTLSLEHLGEYGPAQRNFDRLAALAVTAGDQSADIRFGTATITWPGGSVRASNTSVSHGLGRTPAVAIATAQTGVGGSLTVMPVAIVRNTMTDTTLEISAVTSDESSPAAATTATVWWLAVG
jgi:hypothetical protein